MTKGFLLKKEIIISDLIDAVDEFRSFYRLVASRFPHLSIEVVYATASSKAGEPEVNSRLDAICLDLKDQFSGATVSAIAADAQILLGIVKEPAEQTRSLIVSGTAINQSRGPAYVSLSTLSDYYDFIIMPDGKLNQRLFDDNVRDWEGDVAVNNEIQKTLGGGSDADFWWLNNGVSIICDSATLTGNALHIKNPKIVNGLQTSRQIFSHFGSAISGTDDRLILVRTITAPDDVTRAKIIRATNRQTPILPAQLIATAEIHKDIEIYLRSKGLYYERRKNFWKNQGVPRTDIITITDLAQAMISVVGGKPNVARARPGSLLNTPADEGIVFNTHYTLDMYDKAIKLLRATEALIMDEIPDCGRRDRNNIKFQITAKIVYESLGHMFDVDRFRTWNLIDPPLRRSIIRKTFAAYVAQGATDAVAKSEEFWNCIKDIVP